MHKLFIDIFMFFFNVICDIWLENINILSIVFLFKFYVQLYYKGAVVNSHSRDNYFIRKFTLRADEVYYDEDF